VTAKYLNVKTASRQIEVNFTRLSHVEASLHADYASDCLVEDPATGLSRPRNYLQSLEARVAYLEGLLRETHPEIATDHFNNVTPPGANEPLRQQALGVIPFDSNATGNHQAQYSLQADPQSDPPCLVQPDFNQLESPEAHDDESNDLASDIALLALSASGREPHYFGPSSAISFARIARSILLSPKHFASQQPKNTSHAEERRAPRPRTSAVLPSSTAAYSLCEAYFNHVHSQYPFLHQPTFMSWLEEVLHAQQAGMVDTVKAIPMFFVLMVCNPSPKSVTIAN